VASQKVRDLVGQNHVKPAQQDELADLRQRYGSPEKQSRVETYMCSSAMKNSLCYNDNDVTYGLVNTKSNKNAFSPSDYRKEPWKPKTTLKWYDNPRNRNNIKIE